MEFRSSIVNVRGEADLAALTLSQLVVVYNELNPEKMVKKFADRKAAMTRCLKAYQDWVARQPKPAPSPEVVKGNGRTPGPIMLEVELPIKKHKPSTNRGRIILLGYREEGVSMKEMVELTRWTEQQCRTVLRQINLYSGHGIEEREHNRFWILGEPQNRKRFDWPPRGEVKKHRVGTKRAKALALLLRPEGATLEEVQETCGWDAANAYEGIKLLHGYLGYGVREDEQGRIRARPK
jgi:hypothetical protein